MSSYKPRLHIDYATSKATTYACKHWHYSGCVPPGSRVQYGVWEDDRFIGVIVYGIGSGQCTNGRRYGLRKQRDMAELARIALRDHATPVSRMVAITLKMLKRFAPGIRLVISLADPDQGHIGGIYQAGNWYYTGRSGEAKYWRAPDGKLWHPRLVTKKGWTEQFGRVRYTWRPEQCSLEKKPGKYRYLMPMDDEMRAVIEPLAKPYPTREN